MLRPSRALGFALALALIPRPGLSQDDRGAAALAEAVEGLGVTARVLMIGAHPDDEDTRLVTWLARGRHVETAYLSLTRGDGGQNLIGNELGEALGAIRTEELLAARRIDGARQYFTRAYDFGFSKSADETYRHWPKDTLLGDVVRVVRAFRPHVIVAVFSGTERDGHGHHTVSGLLAREVFDAAADTARYPRAFGEAWATSKLYHNRTYWRHEGATYRYDAGEYDPVLGMSYAEIAGRSRSQHKSQAFGSLEPRGAVTGSLARERTRVNETTPAEKEQGIFDGIDTTWARLRPLFAQPERRAALDSIAPALAAVRAALDMRQPARLLPALGAAERLVRAAACTAQSTSSASCTAPGGSSLAPDAVATRRVALERIHRAIRLAAGIEMLATAPREVAPVGRTVPVRVTLHNRGTRPVRVDFVQLEGEQDAPDLLPGAESVTIAPGDSATREGPLTPTRPTQPWWLVAPRAGATFAVGDGAMTPEGWRKPGMADVVAGIEVDGAHAVIEATVVRRYADPVRGEVTRPAAAAPAIAVTFDRTIDYAPAGTPLDRTVRVYLRSADTASRKATVRLSLPAGLTADSASRTVTLGGYDARQAIAFRVRGRVAAGTHRIAAVVESAGGAFRDGYLEVAYDHIQPQRLYRPAEVTLQAVDVVVPRALRVAYVSGVGDNVAPMLAQLGVPLTVVPADSVAGADLSGFTTVVLGPRAFESSASLTASNARLLDWARAGGTLVVQYQQDIARASLAPYPLTLAPRADRVTEEDAPIRVLDAKSPLLTTPNRITDADFAGWVQERALYMPRTFDAAWTPLLETADPGMPPNRGALLVAPVGRGTYVLTTLSFFRQLPAGNPGAARLFVNLLSARR